MARKSVEIANQLERDILSGAFTEGEVVNEVALAERFQVSRTPVREALLSLASSDLVELVPGRGAVIVGVSIERVFEAYEVLAELLGMAASLAAQRMTMLAKAQLQAVHDDMAAYLNGGKHEAYVALDARFHELILAGCVNRVLVRQIADCKKSIAVVRHASMSSHASLETMYDEHEAIIKAIMAGDAEQARQAMRTHVQLRGDQASELVAAWRLQNQRAEANRRTETARSS